jgi:hypothetical protein
MKHQVIAERDIVTSGREAYASSIAWILLAIVVGLICLLIADAKGTSTGWVLGGVGLLVIARFGAKSFQRLVGMIG